MTINMQKQHSHIFAYEDFNPVVCQLRDQTPKLSVTFCIYFDTTLEQIWNTFAQPDAEGRNWSMNTGIFFRRMGFVDVSELIEPPPHKDREYVEAHLSGHIDPGCGDIAAGLLGENRTNRRMLAAYYVVKGPELLRVLIAEHYTFFKVARDRKQGGGVEAGDFD
jgi:hypothetical protein